MYTRIGIAGLGAIGSTVMRALVDGQIQGMRLEAVSESRDGDYGVPNVSFTELAARCDMICECLPAAIVPALSEAVFARNRDMVAISSAALLIYPEILTHHAASKSRILVPSGAIAGLDGVAALRGQITSAKIISTKPPRGFGRTDIMERTCLFEGNAMQAAKAFPANVNVAATLSLAGIGGERTMVEVWADPTAHGNSHEIRVESPFCTLMTRVDNTPDPANPKTSLLAAQSVIALLKGLTAPLVVL